MENIEVIKEFKFLVNIGYSKKKLRRIAATANLILFLSTMIISLLNGLVAFIGFRYIF
ncbi:MULTISPECIES: hypothetical protein [unclassified Lactobacillus]|uniref:hypothetical protein n=1 Tax=unclassified Lactobacillus TaxID=2620435 RepID=UPI0013147F0A|nr:MULTISPECIES: hypothetical protein [unclassified Lactobacillus]